MAAGTLGVAGEHDWFAVTLAANQAYSFTVNGLTATGSVQVYPAALGSSEAGGFAIGSTAPLGGTAAADHAWFTPATAGTYYVDISDPSTIGAYSVSAIAVSNDYPDNSTTTGTIAVGGPASTGILGVAGEHDWFAVTLAANQAYSFTVNGLTTTGSVQVYPAALGSSEAGGFAIGSTAPLGGTAAADHAWFTPTTAGTYYVDISDPSTIGAYSVSAVAVPNDYPDNTTTTGTIAVGGPATTGTLGVAGEHDWFAVTLAANQAYSFTVNGLTTTGSVQVYPAALGSSEAGGFAIGSAAPLGGTAAVDHAWITPTTAGTYYVDISDPSTIGGYSVSAVAVPNDYPDNSTTTGTIAVGGPASTGTLGVAGEHDWFAVTLAANQAYSFTVNGLTTTGSVQVYPAALGSSEAGGFAIGSTAPLGGTAAADHAWFTPTTAGTYYVDISDPSTIGAYSVSAVAVPNDYPDNITTTGTIAVGGPASTGTLGVAGEHDWFAVTLAANQAYSFTVNGLTTTGSVQVYPAALGSSEAGGFAIGSAAPLGGTAAVDHAWITPTTAGTYYVDISDPSTIGGYSVSAVAVPNDYPDNTTTTGTIALLTAAQNLFVTTPGTYDLTASQTSAIVSGSGAVTLTGNGQANQTITGGSGPLSFTAGAGSSGTLTAGNGSNYIYLPSASNWSVSLGNGADTVVAPTGDDTITTGTGGSFVFLGAGASSVASSGADTILGSTGSATVSAVGSNSDELFALGGPLTFIAGTGASTVVSGTSAATLFGGASGGTLMFGDGPVQYVGGGGTDTVVGLNGSMTAQGGAGGGLFFGGSAGNNVITAGSGPVTAFGAGAGDILTATGSASDLFAGGVGAETLTAAGSTGNNTFFAGFGPETLIGGAGNTALVAGAGADLMDGGSGLTLFLFVAGRTSGAADTISGFDPSHDFVKLAGYSNSTASVLAAVTATNGSTSLTLSDGTNITFAGVTQLNASSFT